MNLDLMGFILEIKPIKDGAYLINLDEYPDIRTHWFALLCMFIMMMLLISILLGWEHVPKDIKTFINNKNIKASIFRIQAYYSIMCGYFCIGFIGFMLAGKTLTAFTNPFSPNNFDDEKMMI